MRVSCESCGAPFEVAEKLVAGKRVKFRCRTCGATFPVDGSMAPPPPTGDGEAEALASEAHEGAPAPSPADADEPIGAARVDASQGAATGAPDAAGASAGLSQDDPAPPSLSSLEEIDAEPAPPSLPRTPTARPAPPAAPFPLKTTRPPKATKGPSVRPSAASEAPGPVRRSDAATTLPSIRAAQGSDPASFDVAAALRAPGVPKLESLGIESVAAGPRVNRDSDILRMVGGPIASTAMLTAPPVESLASGPPAPRPASSPGLARHVHPSRRENMGWMVALVALGLLGGFAYAVLPQLRAKPHDAPSGAIASAAPSPRQDVVVATAAPAAIPDSAQAPAAPAQPGSAAPATRVAPTANAPARIATAAAASPAPGTGWAPTSTRVAAAPPRAEHAPTATLAAAPAPAPAPEPPAAPEPTEGIDRDAARAAIEGAAASVGSCRAGDDPSGIARVAVTFSPSGRVTMALVEGPPFVGTPTGSCVASRFRGISVPPFDGPPVTVRKSVSVR